MNKDLKHWKITRIYHSKKRTNNFAIELANELIADLIHMECNVTGVIYAFDEQDIKCILIILIIPREV